VLFEDRVTRGFCFAYCLFEQRLKKKKELIKSRREEGRKTDNTVLSLVLSGCNEGERGRPGERGGSEDKYLSSSCATTTRRGVNEGGKVPFFFLRLSCDLLLIFFVSFWIETNPHWKSLCTSAEIWKLSHFTYNAAYYQ